METIILCLLLLSVALLLYYIWLGKREKTKTNEPVDPQSGLPEIMGRPKIGSSYPVSGREEHRNDENALKRPPSDDTFNEADPETVLPDWQLEEEDMGRLSSGPADDGFATGVTFDELAQAGEILTNQKLSPPEQKAALDIASKIDGTQLLVLLESKIGDASKKIAQLLDNNSVQKQIDFQSQPQDRNRDNFDVRDFV